MKRTVLITGATGFLGGHLARDLAAHGFEVRGLGRDVARGLTLEADGVSYLPVELANREAMRKACREVDAVVHAAALSTAWASARAYREVNVVGTQVALEAASACNVRRFVHVSTPAVLSRFEHQFDLTEEEPVPSTQTSLYGASKAAAERLVLDERRVETVIVRPKAIYGLGDTALLPRLLEAAAKGQLRVIGRGDTVTHLTHVSDVVRAIRLIIDRNEVSDIYHVAGPQPVVLWEMIADLLLRLGMDPPATRVSVERAMRAARLMEGAWRALRLRGEPPLTRYKVSVVAYSQTLDTTRARREIGFTPQVSITEGLEEVVSGIVDRREQKPTGPSERNRSRPPLSFSLAVAGTVRPPGWAIGTRSPRRVTLPVLIGIIRHPSQGLVLVDCGYGSSSFGGRSLWWAVYRWIVQPRRVALETALATCGYEVGDVAVVLLSHFDPDHAGGLAELANAAIICSAEAWMDVAGHLDGSWWRRIPSRSLPPDLPARLRLLDVAMGLHPADVFGDGSVEVIPLDGHTPGHCGVQVTDLDGTTYLMCADAIWRIGDLEAQRGGTAIHFARRRAAATKSLEFLRRAVRDDPGLLVVPSHCEQTADSLIGHDWSLLAVSSHRQNA